MAKEKNGFTGEYNFMVGVLDKSTNQISFVTAIHNSTRTAEWEAGKPAKVMTKQMAINLQMGLCCNGFMALVIEAPDFLECTNIVAE